MPRWILTCPHCKTGFTHTEIKVHTAFSDWNLPPKPEFPEGGSDMQCPHCGMASLFKRSDLMYSAV